MFNDFWYVPLRLDLRGFVQHSGLLPVTDIKGGDRGQRLSSPTSHKSYRPLTVLSLRLQRRVGIPALQCEYRGPCFLHYALFQRARGSALLRSAADPTVVAAGLGWRKVQRVHDMAEDDLDPLPFHIANVALHSVVTCLLYLLALRMCMIRDASNLTAPSTAEHVLHVDPDEGLGAPEDARQQWVAPAGAGLRQRRCSLAEIDRLPPRRNTGCMQHLHRGKQQGSPGLAASSCWVCLQGSHGLWACI